MLDKQAVLAGIAEPIHRYNHTMTHDFSDWQPLEDAAALLLQGNPVNDEDYIPAFRPLIKMMRTIMEKSQDSSWNWSDPDVLSVFNEVSEGAVYNLFSETIVDILTGILKSVDVGMLVEVGAGTGKVTADLCGTIKKNNLADVPLVISDQSPIIRQTADRLRSAFPGMTIADIEWDLRKGKHAYFDTAIKKPVLVFERFCMPYAGYDAIDVIAEIADILILVDDLSITGEMASFDKIYERIGAQFLIFDEARKRLEKHFSCIHVCDREIIEMVNSPVTSFTLAIK
jgi:hypothetical protein